MIQEFLNVVTTRFKTPLTVLDSKEYLSKVLIPLCDVYPDESLFELGLEVQVTTKYSFYDSLIIAAAINGGCNKLYSEDLHDGQQIRDVMIINPFK